MRDQLGKCYSIHTHTYTGLTNTMIATQRYSKTTCGVKGRDRTHLVQAVGIIFGALGVLAFGLRVMSRVFTGPNRSWGADDWIMTVSVVSSSCLGCFQWDVPRLGLILADAHGTTRKPLSSSYVIYIFSHALILYLTNIDCSCASRIGERHLGSRS